MPKISVIVPAYNAEKSIEKCVRSILNQTYKDLEVIVINDGSTDNTIDILGKLKKTDKRLKVFSIENGGVSHARNFGIDNATGDYITFVDSDDYIDSDMYKCLIDITNRYNVKIAHCSYKNVDESGNVISVVGDTGEIIELAHDKAISCLITGNIFVGGLWNKLFDISLFDDVRLNEDIKYDEDILANFYLFDQVEKSVFVDRAFYNYVACESSSTHSANSLISCRQSLFVSKEINRLSIGKPYELLSKKKVSASLLGLYRAYIFNKSVDKIEKRKVMSEILEFKSQGFYNGKKEKILLIFYRYFPVLFKCLFRFYDKIRVKKLDPGQIGVYYE